MKCAWCGKVLDHRHIKRKHPISKELLEFCNTICSEFYRRTVTRHAAGLARRVTGLDEIHS